MSKKFLAVIALAVASLFTFTACTGETYQFDALANTPAASAEVSSNGGIYVQKGNYSYFINGAEDGTGVNTFGEYHKGRIVRVKTADLLKEGRVVETVVPKIIYAEDPDSAGFSIYGSKIYYTTPHTSKDTSGNVQFTKMDVMVANLDGTGTQLVATIDDNTKQYRFIESNSKVYFVYNDKTTVEINDKDTQVEAIYQIDTASKEKKVLADKVASFAFDSVDGKSTVVAYTKNLYKKDVNGDDVVETRYNNLYIHTIGGSEKLVVAGNVEDSIVFDTMSVVALKDNVVYYNVTDSKPTANKAFFKSVNGAKPVKLAPENYTSIMVAGGSEDAIYVSKDSAINKVTFKDGNVKESKKLCSQSGTIKFEYEDVANNMLYYSVTDNYNVRCVKINEANIVLAKDAIYGTMQATEWASFDFATIDGKTACLFFQDQSSDDIKFVNYMYACLTENAGVKTYRLGLISDAEQQHAIEEGDEKYAVDKFKAE